MSTTLWPYLNFDGDAREAMTFYQSVLGGELSIQSFGEAIPDIAPSHKDRTMHAHLVSDSMNLMASDTHPEHSAPLSVGNNVHLSIVGTDEATLTGYFNQLAAGGTVVMPLQKQFWGDTFGMLIDRFGIQWMVSITAS